MSMVLLVVSCLLLLFFSCLFSFRNSRLSNGEHTASHTSLPGFTLTQTAWSALCLGMIWILLWTDSSAEAWAGSHQLLLGFHLHLWLWWTDSPCSATLGALMGLALVEDIGQWQGQPSHSLCSMCTNHLSTLCMHVSDICGRVHLSQSDQYKPVGFSGCSHALGLCSRRTFMLQWTWEAILCCETMQILVHV